jgi:hypothetical protein
MYLFSFKPYIVVRQEYYYPGKLWNGALNCYYEQPALVQYNNWNAVAIFRITIKPPRICF